jgi:hypothetical protein
MTTMNNDDTHHYTADLEKPSGRMADKLKFQSMTDLMILMLFPLLQLLQQQRLSRDDAKESILDCYGEDLVAESTEDIC